MNPLTHVRMVMELKKELKLDLNLDLLIIGSIIPDISMIDIIPYREAHYDSKGFVEYLQEKDPAFIPLAVGMMLHGEDPKGLDYYTHIDGYIERHEMAVYEIVKKHKPRLWGQRLKDFIHSLIEFTSDSFLDRKYALRLIAAFKSINIDKVSYYLGDYFQGDHKKIYKAMKFLSKFDWTKLTEVEGIAKTWQKFHVYHNIAQSHGAKLMKYVLTAKNVIRKKTMISMLEDCRILLKDDFEKHYQFSKKQLIKLFKKELAEFS